MVESATAKVIVDTEFEQEISDTKFYQSLIGFEKEKGKFDEDWAKKHVLIYSTHRTSEMRTTINCHPDFEGIIRDVPLELLATIVTLLCNQIKATSPFLTLAEIVC